MPQTRERFAPLLENAFEKIGTAQESRNLPQDTNMVFGAFQPLGSRGVAIRNDPRRGCFSACRRKLDLASLCQAILLDNGDGMVFRAPPVANRSALRCT